MSDSKQLHDRGSSLGTEHRGFVAHDGRGSHLDSRPGSSIRSHFSTEALLSGRTHVLARPSPLERPFYGSPSPPIGRRRTHVVAGLPAVLSADFIDLLVGYESPDISCTAARSCDLSLDNAGIAETTDGGTSWHQVALPAVVGSVLQVSCVLRTGCVAIANPAQGLVLNQYNGGSMILTDESPGNSK